LLADSLWRGRRDAGRQALDLPGIKAINAVAEAGSAGLGKVSAAASSAGEVAMVPVNVLRSALAQVGAGVAAVTPAPLKAVAAFAWSFMPEIDSPFVVVIMAIQFASDIQWYKRMASLVWKMMTGSGREAACDFCDEVMTTVMDLEDAKDDAADADELCGAVCPFNIQYCMDMCKRLMDAVGKRLCCLVGLVAAFSHFEISFPDHGSLLLC